METCNFLFDFIVTKFESPKVVITDLKKLRVDLVFNSKTLAVTESRINVSEFKIGKEVELKEEPDNLRKAMKTCGMAISVNYGHLALGAGNITFAQNFIDSIVKGMSEQLYTDTCNFELNGNVVGTLEFLCRMRIKCEDTKDNLNKSTQPQDILFVMANSERRDWAPEEDKGLDPERYHSFNITEVKNREIFENDPKGNSACCEMKMAQDFEQFIDSIVKRTLINITHSGGFSKHPESNNHTKFPSFSNLAPNRRVSSVMCNRDRLTMPIGETGKPLAKSKSMPTYKGSDKDKGETADNILIAYLGKPPATADQICKDSCDKESSEQPEKQPKCRCTCQNAKTCTHCRIRKQYAEYVVSSKTSELTDSEEWVQTIESDRVKSNPSQPFLARVFSELRALNGLNDLRNPSELNSEEEEVKVERRTYAVRKSFLYGRKKQKKQSVKSRQMVKHESKGRVGTGHKYCGGLRKPVSHRHGWNWTSSHEARKHGWRPGAILRPMKKIMNFFLYNTPDHKRQLPAEKKVICQLPILNLSKRRGEIVVTMQATNSHIRMKPITIKIVKSELAAALSDIKKALKLAGFRKCTCHKTVMLCVCRNSLEKKQLKNALDLECNRRRIGNCVEHLVLTDTSESDEEYDFDIPPPSGITKPTFPKPITVNMNTQTAANDRQLRPRYPVRYDPYWRSYDCAVGDRYAGTAFGAPCENVFEDGVFGYRGGGLHGKSATAGGRPKSEIIWGRQPGGPMRGGPTGLPGGPSFPGAIKKPGAGKSKTIPVHMPKRYYEAIKNEAKAAAEAKQKAEAQKKKGPDMMEYMMKMGGFPVHRTLMRRPSTDVRCNF